MYDDLVKRLRELHPEEFGNEWDFAFAVQQAMHEAADAIETLRKNQRVKGEWKKDGDVLVCSECGEEHEWIDYRASFCDECGADMRESNARYWEEHDE